MDLPRGDYSKSLISHLICLARQQRAVIGRENVKLWLRDGCTAPEVLWRVQAIGLSPPPVYAPGDFAIGHPVLPQATEPPPPGHSQLVTNERCIVQQPMHGSAVIVSCPQCGHVGPAIVNKEAGFITYFSSGLLCFLGCCVLSLFPFCCDSTKDWVYRCSQCNVLFGRERP